MGGTSGRWGAFHGAPAAGLDAEPVEFHGGRPVDVHGRTPVRRPLPEAGTVGPTRASEARGLYSELTMARERLVMAVGTLILAALAAVLWWDYLGHSAKIYDDRDAAHAQMTAIDKEIGTAQDADQLVRLMNDRAIPEALYGRASRQINDMDGWGSLEWKVKNTTRLAAPVAAVLFAAFTLLSVLHPIAVSPRVNRP